MSWYRRKPRLKTPDKPKPHRTSPLSEQVLKNAKDKTGPTTPKKEGENDGNS